MRFGLERRHTTRPTADSPPPQHSRPADAAPLSPVVPLDAPGTGAERDRLIDPSTSNSTSRGAQAARELRPRTIVLSFPWWWK